MGKVGPSGKRPGGKRPTKKSGSGPQITTRAVLLLMVVLLLVGSYTATFRAWWSAQSQISASQAERTQLKSEIAGLQDQKERFDDPAYIRQQARERFGWVMPGEIGYRVIGADGEVRGDVPTLDAPAEARPDAWYDKLWGSVVTSGEPEGDVAPPDTTDDVLGEDDE
ncbi:FtsB family cell division protein [Aeromicrobium sp. CF3.5]|uniref:FtsB family cell division protein n=1 Tax=Aeromicrobium sp. CF3.5 TaxID=3373078 RepID=UPI003EE5835B